MMRTPYNTIPEGSVKPGPADDPTGNPNMLESRIIQLSSWGRILSYIAASANAVDLDDLHVIACALEALAQDLHRDAAAGGFL